MPYIKIGDQSGNNWEFGIPFEEIINLFKYRHKNKDPYLIYNTDEIQAIYPNEKIKWLYLDKPNPLDRRIYSPYELVFDYRQENWKKNWGVVKFSPETYTFPKPLALHKNEMVNKFIKEGRLYKDKKNGECVRLHQFNILPTGIPEYTVQKAYYYDQVGTNLTADHPFSKNLRSLQDSKTVRDWDMIQSGGIDQPPEFNKSKLANTIGVAVGVTAKDSSGKVVPLRCKRSKNVAVYEGQWHVPLSFSLAWTSIVDELKPNNLIEMIIHDLAQELVQELDLELFDFKPIVPLAFCRDLLRAGKPQFFFLLESNLGVDQLISKAKLEKAEYKGKFKTAEVLSQDTYSSELLGFSILINPN